MSWFRFLSKLFKTKTSKGNDQNSTLERNIPHGRFSIGGSLGEEADYFVIKETSGVDAEQNMAISEAMRLNQRNIEYEDIKLKNLKVLDLTDPVVLATLKLEVNNVTKLDFIFTQALGNAARENGFEGIIYPSTSVKGVRNLVVFK